MEADAWDRRRRDYYGVVGGFEAGEQCRRRGAAGKRRFASIILEGRQYSRSKIGAAMFFGEYLDCTVELGKNILQTHQRHTLVLRRGDQVWIELPAGECMALPADQ